MAGNESDKVGRAYARLKSLKDNLPQGMVSRRYVDEYHDALKHLEDLDFDVGEFKISDSHVRPRVVSSNYVTGEVRYSNERYVDRAFLLTKLGAVLSYFELKRQQAQSSAPQHSIGFRGARQ